MTERLKRLRRVESAYAGVAREAARRIGLVQARKADVLAASAEARDAMARMPEIQDALGFGRWLARREAEIARLDEELVRLTRSCIDSLLREKVAKGLLDSLELHAARRSEAEVIAELLPARASLPQAGRE